MRERDREREIERGKIASEHSTFSPQAKASFLGMLECQQCEHADKSATQARKSLRQPLEEFKPNNWPLVARQLRVPGQGNAAGERVGTSQNGVLGPPGAHKAQPGGLSSFRFPFLSAREIPTPFLSNLFYSLALSSANLVR